MRLSATLVNGGKGERKPLHVKIDGITRTYEKWSGRPMWKVAPQLYTNLLTQTDGSGSLSETRELLDMGGLL